MANKMKILCTVLVIILCLCGCHSSEVVNKDRKTELESPQNVGEREDYIEQKEEIQVPEVVKEASEKISRSIYSFNDTNRVFYGEWEIVAAPDFAEEWVGKRYSINEEQIIYDGEVI